MQKLILERIGGDGRNSSGLKFSSFFLSTRLRNGVVIQAELEPMRQVLVGVQVREDACEQLRCALQRIFRHVGRERDFVRTCRLVSLFFRARLVVSVLDAGCTLCITRVRA